MSKKELEKAIVQSQQNYKDIVLGNVSKIYEECLRVPRTWKDCRVYLSGNVKRASSTRYMPCSCNVFEKDAMLKDWSSLGSLI